MKKNEPQVPVVEVSADTLKDCRRILKKVITSLDTKKTKGSFSISAGCGCKRRYNGLTVPVRSIKCKHGIYILKYTVKKKTKAV